MMSNRRDFLKQGTVVGGVVTLSSLSYYRGKLSLLGGKAHAKDAEQPPSPIPEGWKPFIQELQAPLRLEPVPLEPPPGTGNTLPEDGIGAQVGSDKVYHGIAQEFFDKRFNLSDENVPEPYKQELTTYELTMEERPAPMFGREFPMVPKVGYVGSSVGVVGGVEVEGRFPNSTIIARFKEPIVVRVTNKLKVETSVHLHGGHNPAHSDGFPDFFVLEDKTRDYFYPNFVPRQDGDLNRYDNFDLSEVPSTMWYHDHGMDATGFNAARGLAGFYLVTDEIERELMNPDRMGGQILPNLETDYGMFDIPLALVDQRLKLDKPDNTLFYDFLDHNGRLGDLFTVNGFVQPVLKVKRRKYRFRILNASNARWYTIRLSNRQPFLLVATDSWLLPEVQRHRKLTLANANRRDIIVDFTDAPDELYLENIMEQEDGRGPKRINPKAKVRLLKFLVEGNPVEDKLVITKGTKLRPHVPLNPEEVKITRTFEFTRRNGAWPINDKWFSPRRADAVPALEQTERWILKNKSGGWSHPIHIHLAASQVQKVNGRKPPRDIRFNSDTMALGGGDEFEILIRFSTFTGPFVFHCHNLEHEDMRMMAVFDPRPVGDESPLNGFEPVDLFISGIDDEPELFEDLDLSPIENEGVGFPLGDFDASGGGVAPSPGEEIEDDESGDDSRNKHMPRGG